MVHCALLRNVPLEICGCTITKPAMVHCYVPLRRPKICKHSKKMTFRYLLSQWYITMVHCNITANVLSRNNATYHRIESQWYITHISNGTLRIISQCTIGNMWMYYYETRDGALLCTIAQTKKMQAYVPSRTFPMVHSQWCITVVSQCTIAPYRNVPLQYTNRTS